MVKYKMKPSFVDAIEFEEGMEDGFNFYPIMSNQYICSMTNEELKTKPYPRANKIAFIETFHGRKQVRVGDYIITDEKGHRSVLDAFTFKELYSPVIDDDVLNSPQYVW